MLPCSMMNVHRGRRLRLFPKVKVIHYQDFARSRSLHLHCPGPCIDPSFGRLYVIWKRNAVPQSTASGRTEAQNYQGPLEANRGCSHAW